MLNFIMRIIFVRHGHPNYRKDCLTEEGHAHAEAAALRLKDEGITEIHSSSCGRAVETAEHTAAHLGLSVTAHDFMREIGWGSVDGSELYMKGNPWHTIDAMILQGQPLSNPNWRTEEPFCRNETVQYIDRVGEGIDEWLKTLGYEREGEFYRVTGTNTDRTVAMFSHGGSSCAALSHMFNIPFPLFCCSLTPGLTGITIVKLSDEVGTLAAPRMELANDGRHIVQVEQVPSR